MLSSPSSWSLASPSSLLSSSLSSHQQQQQHYRYYECLCQCHPYHVTATMTITTAIIVINIITMIATSTATIIIATIIIIICLNGGAIYSFREPLECLVLNTIILNSWFFVISLGENEVLAICKTSLSAKIVDFTSFRPKMYTSNDFI